VSADNLRLLELRRRVHADPASIAFAQLAEECRRAGDNEEAVAVCRNGLVHHPDYLSARVTLGRALLELDRLDESETELKTVLATASDNLAANRALAEVYQKRGQLPEALEQFKRALDVAKFDPDIEHEVQRIQNVVSPPPPPPRAEASPIAVEDLFDFDTLLAQLGGRTQPKPEFPTANEPIVAAPSALDAVSLRADDSDPLSVLERQLRENEDKKQYEDVPVFLARKPEISGEPDVIVPTEEELHERRVLAELESWLAAIVADRHNHISA
jgi:tetratricopeptide (TPR) repeat protein